MADRNRFPVPEEDPPRRPPRAARQVRDPRPAGSLGIPAGPQHDRRCRRPCRRPGRHRPGPDPVHRRARPGPRRPPLRHPLRALREAPRRPPRPAHRRRHRPSPAPPGTETHLRQDSSRTALQAHRRRVLHHHDRAVKSPTMAANTLKLRAVAQAPVAGREGDCGRAIPLPNRPENLRTYVEWLVDAPQLLPTILLGAAAVIVAIAEARHVILTYIVCAVAALIGF